MFRHVFEEGLMGGEGGACGSYLTLKSGGWFRVEQPRGWARRLTPGGSPRQTEPCDLQGETSERGPSQHGGQSYICRMENRPGGPTKLNVLLRKAIQNGRGAILNNLPGFMY